MVRPSRARRATRPRISHLRDLHQGGRQGGCGAHDRPPRNLYERRGLSGRHSGRPRLPPSNLVESATLLRPVHCGRFRLILGFNTQKIRGVTPCLRLLPALRLPPLHRSPTPSKIPPSPPPPP